MYIVHPIKFIFGCTNSMNIIIFQQHALATVASIVMPALLPKNTLLLEQGPHFIHGDNQKDMLEISPDGFIAMPKNGMENALGDVTENLAIEIKCPFPQENCLPVHYKIPVYYVCQLLSVMKVKEINKIWYISYCKESTVVMELKFDEKVWNTVFGQLKMLYDIENIKMPKGKVIYRDEMRGILKKYPDSNSELIAEVPSVLSEEDVEVSRICGAYALSLNFNTKGSSLNSLCARL